MLYISEWLPNPKGADHGAEWVELGNNSNYSIPLSGWSLKNGSGQKFVMPEGVVPERGVFLVPLTGKGFTLRNTNEGIFLFDPSGNLADESHIFGVAQEGKSYSSISGQFIVSEPTPGGPNNAQAGTALIAATYPESRVVESSLSTGGVVALTIMVSLAVTALFIFIITQHDDIQKLVFARDEEIR